ncbi:helix-turn-helix domain-containing protein [Desulfitibacter alkalitolerans]|uniref:helix-turn-helix domain-containing protein n=1 Tax=Desulfitibacter alkalitolerans TaxID=264641 RepID=UPI000687013D|nr:helix-turn-helix domain-containing protein [Desulfitibacter alkalitolerans]
MKKELSNLRVLIINAQNGDQDSVVHLVHWFIPLVKKYSRRMGYEEAYADLIVWMVNAVHKYRSVNDTDIIAGTASFSYENGQK